MKAAVLREVGQPLSIEEISIGNPKAHEVLVHTAAVGVCHSDLHYIDGLYACPKPTVLGHESAGVVEKVGSEVTYVKPGDHVITCLSVFAAIANTAPPAGPSVARTRRRGAMRTRNPGCPTRPA
jgi:S-(hydroxymethyl)glutathione dehydrogenase / alcohol dehydrogenase